MGYYSDVCLVLSTKGLEELNCRHGEEIGG